MNSKKAMGCVAGLGVGFVLLSVAIAIAIALMEYDVLQERHATKLGAGLGIAGLVTGFKVYAFIAKRSASPDAGGTRPNDGA